MKRGGKFFFSFLWGEQKKRGGGQVTFHSIFSGGKSMLATMSILVFSSRPFPNILKYRDHQWDLPTIWKTRHILKSSASMYESSGSQFFRTTTGIQSGPKDTNRFHEDLEDHHSFKYKIVIEYYARKCRTNSTK